MYQRSYFVCFEILNIVYPKWNLSHVELPLSQHTICMSEKRLSKKVPFRLPFNCTRVNSSFKLMLLLLCEEGGLISTLLDAFHVFDLWEQNKRPDSSSQHKGDMTLCSIQCSHSAEQYKKILGWKYMLPLLCALRWTYNSDGENILLLGP